MMMMMMMMMMMRRRRKMTRMRMTIAIRMRMRRVRTMMRTTMTTMTMVMAMVIALAMVIVTATMVLLSVTMTTKIHVHNRLDHCRLGPLAPGKPQLQARAPDASECVEPVRSFKLRAMAALRDSLSNKNPPPFPKLGLTYHASARSAGKSGISKSRPLCE